MDSEEMEKIMPEKTHPKRKKRKKEKLKKKIISSFKINFANNTVKILTILIIIFLMIYIFQFILLLNQNKKVEKIKNNMNNDNNNKNKNTKLSKNENQNYLNYINLTNHTITPENISRNIFEEIEQYVKTLKKVETNEIYIFRKNNSDNILYDKTKYKRSDNPDISVILTMSNQAHCIHKALRSIQNQSLKNIEIIISLDCSLDNSTETILSYMEEDERIILIDHDVVEGTMKNRVDGFRKAKGKYITALDGDDAFIQKNILKDALYIANLGNLDIVEFYANMYKDNKYVGLLHYHKIDKIIKQPELRTKFFNIIEDNDKWRPIICRSIWGKLIKKEVMHKALEMIGPKYTDDYMMWYEDTTIVVTLYQIAQSYYIFKEVGYYYSRDEFKGRNPQLPNKKCKKKGDFSISMDAVKFLNFLYDKMEDNEIERQTLYHEIIAVNAYDFSKFSNLNDHYDMIYRVLDGMADSKYLNERQKERLREIKNEIVNKQNKN